MLGGTRYPDHRKAANPPNGPEYRYVLNVLKSTEHLQVYGHRARMAWVAGSQPE
jgi:hypothetical protein